MRFSVVLGIAAAAAVASVGMTVAQAPKTQWDGVFTEAQLKRGQALYSDHCVSCHGDDLMGTGSEAPELVGSKFNQKYYDLTLSSIVDYLTMKMPLDAPGTLSREQQIDVLTYVMSKNGAPTGAAELAPAALSTIKYAAKP